MKKKRGRKSSIPVSDKKKIITFFKTEQNNSVSDIINKFGYKEHSINRILTEYLNSKTNGK